MWSNTVMAGESEKRYMSILDIKDYPFSESTLKAHYRKAAFKFHPDVSDAKSEEQMKMVNAAYTFLKEVAQPDYAENHIEKEKQFRDTDIFKFWQPCEKCNSKGYILREVPDVESCTNCPPIIHRVGWWFLFERPRGQGYQFEDCPSCIKGETTSGKECNRCAGTGKVKKVCAACNGKGIKRNKENFIKELCLRCHGNGRIEIKPFNPVIPKGAVLNGK